MEGHESEWSHTVKIVELSYAVERGHLMASNRSPQTELFTRKKKTTTQLVVSLLSYSTSRARWEAIRGAILSQLLSFKTDIDSNRCTVSQ